ncbi:MAG: hypothetical protein JO297_05050 [Nitrososphaeraceae archaeon]|nr:hypothetical protein [Nitrososphaeraceae archaeon]
MVDNVLGGAELEWTLIKRFKQIYNILSESSAYGRDQKWTIQNMIRNLIVYKKIFVDRVYQ